MNNVKLFETMDEYTAFIKKQHELPLVAYTEEEKNSLFQKAQDQDKIAQDIIIRMYELVNHPYIHVNS